jgi:hypothetical protein
MRVGFTTLRLFAAVAEEKNIARRTDHLAHSDENAGPRRNPESCRCGSRAARRFRAKSRPLSRASPRSARGITGQWRLDLDHLRAEISGATGGERPSDKIPYLKNSQSAKRSASRPIGAADTLTLGAGHFVHRLLRANDNAPPGKAFRGARTRISQSCLLEPPSRCAMAALPDRCFPGRGHQNDKTVKPEDCGRPGIEMPKPRNSRRHQ